MLEVSVHLHLHEEVSDAREGQLEGAAADADAAKDAYYDVPKQGQTKV